MMNTLKTLVVVILVIACCGSIRAGTGSGESNIFTINNRDVITINATNNWDGLVTVESYSCGNYELFRKDVDTLTEESLGNFDGGTYEDKLSLTQLKKPYKYILKDASNGEIIAISNEVTPEIIVVLVRGYDSELITDGVDADYWTLNKIKEKDIDKYNSLISQGMVESVEDWFEDSARNITCWDASVDLNGKKSIEWNSDTLNDYISQNRTGDYKNAKVNLVGHSMGGLISRQFADEYDIVKNVICLQTPHTGSTLAEIAGWFAGDARDNLKPSFLKTFNEDFPPSTPLYLVYSDNHFELLKSPGFITAHSIIMTDRRFKDEFIGKTDGAVPLLSGYGAIYRKKWYETIWQYKLQYDISQNSISGEMNNSFDHGTGYRHKDTLNKVMDWLGYPQASAQSSSMMQMRTLAESEPESVPLYFIAGFSGHFDNSQPVSETVNVGSSQKAYFRANVSDAESIFALTNPNAIVIDSTTAETDPDITYNIEDGIQSYEVLTPLSGTWTLNLSTLLSEPDGVEYGLTAFEDQFITFTVSGKNDWTNTGQSMLLTAELLDNSGAITGATVTADVALPDETVQSISLFDDGTNGDDTASDGIYCYAFTSTSLEGAYNIDASATGTTSTASTFERTATTSFTATPADIAIAGSITDEGVDTNANSYFDILRFNVLVTVSTEKNYRFTASFIDSYSETISLINSGSLPLTTDSNSISVEVTAEDIVMNNVTGPYTLQNIEISDADTGMTIAATSDYTTTAYLVSAFEPLDSDEDGLSDALELSIGTDINKIDTDADGATDYQEVAYDGESDSYNPAQDPNPMVVDSDSDTIPDGYEINYGLNPLVDDTSGDLDGDALTNQQEYDLHTRPDKIDTDDDGRNDKWEIDNATNPLVYEVYTKFVGDIDLNASVGISDIGIMANQWLSAPGTPSADIAPSPLDGIVNLIDFAKLAEHWLEGTP